MGPVTSPSECKEMSGYGFPAFYGFSFPSVCLSSLNLTLPYAQTRRTSQITVKVNSIVFVIVSLNHSYNRSQLKSRLPRPHHLIRRHITPEDSRTRKKSPKSKKAETLRSEHRSGFWLVTPHYLQKTQHSHTHTHSPLPPELLLCCQLGLVVSGSQDRMASRSGSLHLCWNSPFLSLCPLLPSPLPLYSPLLLPSPPLTLSCLPP